MQIIKDISSQDNNMIISYQSLKTNKKDMITSTNKTTKKSKDKDLKKFKTCTQIRK